jgi:hypothetical protein
MLDMLLKVDLVQSILELFYTLVFRLKSLGKQFLHMILLAHLPEEEE